MSEANVIFTLDGSNLTIQCSKTDKMRDICQRFAIKAEKNINSVLFLYGGNQINFDLTFEAQATSLDKSNNAMKVLAYKNESDGFACPKCGEKIHLNTEKIDEIISSLNNIKDTINGIKFNIENLIKISVVNTIHIQLKNINVLLNTVNEDIRKNNEKLESLFKENNNVDDAINNEKKNKNVIRAELDIKANDSNNIILFNTDINNDIDIYLNNKKINMIKENNQWIINYKFEKDGIYTFDIIFQNIMSNLTAFFSNCENIISLDFSNFKTSNVTSMGWMFYKCHKLKEIKGINKFITNKVTDMQVMFSECKELEYLDLSNFNTANVTNMSGMFNHCHKLKEIKGINNFNTIIVTNMSGMFPECNELEYIDLSNFNTIKVTNMKGMFKRCEELNILNLSNFNINNVVNMERMFAKENDLYL